MINFKEIEVKNFMSVGNDGLKFDYQRGLFYCYGVNHDVSSDLDGTPISNGSGKTVCLVDAPLFALYGRSQRNINKNELINIQNGCDCVVKLTFEKNGIEYIIERGLKPDKITIYKNGDAEKEEAKKREANRVIVDEILDGISFEVFKNLIVLNGTSSKHFFEYGKNEKRVFINEVFRLGFLDYLQDNLTEEVKEKKSKMERLEIQKESKEKEVERLKGLYEATEDGDVVDISLEDLQAKLQEESTKLIYASSRVKDIEQNTFKGSAEDYNKKYETANARIEDVSRDILKYEFFITDLTKQIAKLRNDWGRVTNQNICVHCTQHIPDELKARLQGEIKESASKIKEELKNYQTEKSNKEASIYKMKMWTDAARTAISEYESKSLEISHARTLIQQYENQIKHKTSNPISLEKINEEIKNAEEEMKNINKEYNEVKTDLTIHKVCRDIVSDKNFYGYYISVFRKYLNQAINQYLTKMASPHIITFNNDLEAEVSNGSMKISSYASLSTGEKAKINLSLLLSFFDVLHAFHRMRTSILVLDEVLDCGIDGEGIKLLNNILKEKIDENKDLGIYVVSHKNADTTWDKLEGVKKVVFEKRNGFTSYKGD
jgi:DNA repair exonuclease SbcCD ATPase subunit